MNSLMIGCVADFVSVGVYLFRHKIFFQTRSISGKLTFYIIMELEDLVIVLNFQNPCHGLNHFWLGPPATILHTGHLKLTLNSQQLFSTIGYLEYISTI